MQSNRKPGCFEYVSLIFVKKKNNCLRLRCFRKIRSGTIRSQLPWRPTWSCCWCWATFPGPLAASFAEVMTPNQEEKGERRAAHTSAADRCRKNEAEKRGGAHREREREGEGERENARKVFEAIHEWFARITQRYRGCRRRKVQQLTCRNLWTAAMWEVRFTSEREWCHPRQLDVLKKCKKEKKKKKKPTWFFSVN